MKNIRNLIHGLVACGTVFALVSTAAAQTAIEGTAKVIRVKGPARYTLGNNVWQPLKPGAVLKPGTIIQTGKEQGSLVDLVLSDAGTIPASQPAVYKPSIPSSATSFAYQSSAAQNVVRIYENSAVGIDKLTTTQTGADAVTETQLDLKAGRISGSVKKMSAASRYEVKLPNGVAGIRGTTYYISGDMVQVLDGSVVVAYVDPKSGNVTTQVVGSSQQLDMRTGEVSSLPPSVVKDLGQMDKAFPVVTTAETTTVALDRTIEHHASPHGKAKGHNK